MQPAVLKAILVILIGIYAIRSSWFVFSGNFSPLTPVAWAIFVFCIFLFHRPPTEMGTWLYFASATCAIALVANFSLLFSKNPIYSNPINYTFSLVSVICWIVALAIFASKFMFDRPID